MNDFDENTMVNNFIGPQPSAYALHHLADFEYAELWYFTQEGCADAMHQRTQNEDSFGLTKVDDCYVPVSQVNPVSVSVRPVTFPQM